jgi:FkbM family methyltransferase
LLERLLTPARRAFYKAGGPWQRARLFEALGSRRYSRPALFDMDTRLEALLPKRGGVYLEAGAHDGYTQSNSYYLERHRGWSGVLVEAVPELYERARRRRPRSRVFNCALVGPDHAGEVVEVEFGDLMSVVGSPGHAAQGLEVAGRAPYRVSVPARTLSSVLDEAGVSHFDLLVLDIEGGELEALRGLDFERHSPDHMLIEMLELERMRGAFDELLHGRYESVDALSPYDVLYRRIA